MSNKKEIECSIHEFCIEEFDEIVKKKFIEYLRKYKRKPCYLKVPLWIYSLLRNDFEEQTQIDIREVLKYKMLMLCETISIEKIEEIEVF